MCRKFNGWRMIDELNKHCRGTNGREEKKKTYSVRQLSLFLLSVGVHCMERHNPENISTR